MAKQIQWNEIDINKLDCCFGWDVENLLDLDIGSIQSISSKEMLSV